MTTQQRVGRRKLLKVVPVAAVAAVGGYLGIEYAPWLNYDAQADLARKPLEKTLGIALQMREILRYATLAANAHNAQPWRFLVGRGTIEIHPDYNRRLPVVDAADRELWISLGCALENAVIAARAAGYACDVTYPDAVDVIRIALTADIPRGGPLFEAIPFRQNTRSQYNGKAIERGSIEKLRTLSVEQGVALHFVLEPSGMKTVADYVAQGNLNQYANTAFVKELVHWLRFNKKEALASLDGLALRCTGLPDVPRWLGRMVVTGTTPEKEADADTKKLLSSAGAVIVVSAVDDKTSWVRTGQVYQRMALAMTSLDIKSAFLNQPIEVAHLRGQLQSALALGQARPQLLVRFGYAARMPRSLRRAVEQVITES